MYRLQDRTKFTTLVSRTGNPDEIIAGVKGEAFLAYRERRKRVTKSASLLISGGSTLMATMRSMERCRALNTYPMPP
jgi:hypothetical protein